MRLKEFCIDKGLAREREFDDLIRSNSITVNDFFPESKNVILKEGDVVSVSYGNQRYSSLVYHPSKEEQYKRQLGGTNAALERSRQQAVDLSKENRELRELVDSLLLYIHKGTMSPKAADSFDSEVMPILEKYEFL